MVVAFDAVGPSAAGQTATAPTSVTWSHTVTGSQTALVVFVGVGENSGVDTTKTISGVTYNGVAMTQIGTPVHCNGAAAGYVACYGLIAPATGAHNVVVTFASAPSTSQCGSMSFAGADQTAPFGTPVTASGNTATATAAVASNTSGNIISFGVGGGAAFGANPTSPATTRWLANFDGNSGGGNSAGATIPATGSSVTCSWGLTSDWWALFAVEIKAAGGGNSQAVTPAAETDTALAPSAARSRATTPAAEGDQALTPTAARTAAVTPASESDAAVTPGHARTITPAAETDTAVTPTKPGGTPITPAAETDTGVTPSRARATQITPAAESDTGATPAALRSTPTTPAAEIDAGVTPTRARARSVTPAAESDTAVTPGQARAQLIVPAVEVDQAVDVHNPNELLRDLDLKAILEPGRFTSTVEQARFTSTVEPGRFRTEIEA